MNRRNFMMGSAAIALGAASAPVLIKTVDHGAGFVSSHLTQPVSYEAMMLAHLAGRLGMSFEEVSAEQKRVDYSVTRLAMLASYGHATREVRNGRARWIDPRRVDADGDMIRVSREIEGMEGFAGWVDL